MGRWVYGLVVSAAFAAGCAAAATPTEVSQHSTGDSPDLAGSTGTTVNNCVDGGSCTTNNPGDCAMGHAACSGDQQLCVPDVTTQRCYTGAPSTMNKGVCKAGTQTCIGALGSCDGEVKPAAQEDCFNDLDDDCDGVVNNGCPVSLTTGTPRALTARGNPAGGAAFSLRCPAGTFVSKLINYGDSTDQYIGGIDIFCATPTLVRGASTYSVTETASATPLTRHAGNITLTSTATFDCGATAFTPAYYVEGQSDSGGLDALGNSCATGALTLGSDNKLSIALTKSTSLSYAGYTAFGTQFEDDCGAGEVLIGYDGRSGNWFDELHGICAPLQVVYK
ncbi:MAG: hypothetical protein ACXVAN_09665 [Polyangia bacterium]